MVEFKVQAPLPQMPIDIAPFHTWTFEDGTEWTQFFRTRGGYLLRFPNLADYIVTPDGQTVTCLPTPGLSAVEWQHLYLNQVLPLALSRRGRMVFHASAVERADGAICFLAASGRGKSTIGAYFAVNGDGLLTDDGLLLDELEGSFSVFPSHPSVRLWPDSEKALLGPSVNKAPALSFTSKSRVFAGKQIKYCDRPRPLLRAYFLGEGTVRDLEMRRITEAEALISWIKHSFLLDIEDQSALSQQFKNVAKLVEAIPCYHLDFPRRYDVLAEVRNRIIQHT